MHYYLFRTRYIGDPESMEEQQQQPGPPGVDFPPQPPPQWLPPPNMQHFQQQFQMPWWPVQQQHQAPPRVTLTPFWPSAPAAWFRLAEATFHRLNVVDPNLQFDLTLPALQESTVAQLQDILQAADNLPNPYEALKAELIRQHAPNVLEQLNKIVFSPELGGQPPSQLMRTLLTHLPAGEPAGLLFKHLFLLRLPEDLREQVSKKIERLDARELAEYADTRWHVRNAKRSGGKTVAAVGAAEESSTDPPGAVAAVSAPAKSQRGGHRGGKRTQARGTANKQKPAHNYICFTHCKYGDKTWECADPDNCKFPGNE